MITPAGFAHCTVVFSSAAIPGGGVCTFGVEQGVIMTPEQTAASIHDAIYDTCQANISQEITVVETHVKFGPDDTGPAGAGGAPFSGTASGALAPPNVTHVFRKRTNFGGRQGRGRMFWPGVLEGSVGNDGRWVSGFTAEWDSSLAALLTRLENDGHPMVLLHNAAANTPDVVTSLTLAPVVGTLRQRLR